MLGLIKEMTSLHQQADHSKSLFEVLGDYFLFEDKLSLKTSLSRILLMTQCHCCILIQMEEECIQ